MGNENREERRAVTPQPMTEATSSLLAGSAVLQLHEYARAHPRIAPQAILKRATEELEVLPAMAADYFYAIPYKDHARGCRNRKTCDCPIGEWVMGTGVKGARTLLRLYGNCAVSSAITAQDDEAVYLVGRFVDFESNTLIERPHRVMRCNQWGQKYDHVLAQEIQASASKVERNAVLAGLPEWLSATFFARARALAAQAGRDEAANAVAGPEAQAVPVETIVATEFEKLGVTRAQLQRVTGTNLAAGSLNDEMLGNLRGILKGVRNGEIAISEVFGQADDSQGAEPEIASESAAQASLEGLIGAAKASDERPGSGPQG